MNFLNNTFVTLEAPVASSDRVIFVKKFVGNLGENFPISAVLVESDSTGKVIKREIIRITGKSDNMLNVERAIESCPQSDDAENHSANPLNFSENAVLIHTLTAGDLSKIVGKVDEKLWKSELRTGLNQGFIFVGENGEEKILNDLPENIVNKVSNKFLENSGFLPIEVWQNIEWNIARNFDLTWVSQALPQAHYYQENVANNLKAWNLGNSSQISPRWHNIISFTNPKPFRLSQIELIGDFIKVYIDWIAYTNISDVYGKVGTNFKIEGEVFKKFRIAGQELQWNIALAQVHKVTEKINDSLKVVESNSINCGIKINLPWKAKLNKVFVFNKIISTTAIFTLKKWDEIIKTVNGVLNSNEIDFEWIELEWDIDYIIIINDTATVGGRFYNTNNRDILNFWKSGINNNWSPENRVYVFSGYELDFGGRLLKPNKKIIGFDNIATIVDNAKKWDIINLNLDKRKSFRLKWNYNNNFYYIDENWYLTLDRGEDRIPAGWIDSWILQINDERIIYSKKTELTPYNRRPYITSSLIKWWGWYFNFFVNPESDIWVNVEYSLDNLEFKSIFEKEYSSSGYKNIYSECFYLPKCYIKIQTTKINSSSSYGKMWFYH